MSKAASVFASFPTTEARPEIVREQSHGTGTAIVEKPLSTIELLYNQAWLRKVVILVCLALIWEIYGRYLNNDLLFPTFTATVAADETSKFLRDISSWIGFCISGSTSFFGVVERG